MCHGIADGLCCAGNGSIQRICAVGGFFQPGKGIFGSGPGVFQKGRCGFQHFRSCTGHVRESLHCIRGGRQIRRNFRQVCLEIGGNGIVACLGLRGIYIVQSLQSHFGYSFCKGAVYLLLNRCGAFGGYLGGNGIFFFIGVVNDFRVLYVRGKNTHHILGEILRQHNGGIIFY